MIFYLLDVGCTI